MSHEAPQAIDVSLPPDVTPAGPPVTPAEEVFEVRLFRASDIAYVRDSWLRSAWDVEDRRLKDRGVSGRERRGMGVDWYARNRPMVTSLIGASDVVILVAVDRLDDDHIAGWLAIRAGRRVAGAIKHAYRRDQGGVSWGVDEMLARAAGVLEREL